MSNKPKGASQSQATNLTTSSAAPTDAKTSPPKKEPISQQRANFRNHWPVWAKQLPSFSFPPPKEDFKLLSDSELEQIFQSAEPSAVQRVKEDMKFLDIEILRFFRERDYEAAKQQNTYRLYQILFIVLATVATLIGSFQALSLTNKPEWVPFFAFIETLVALLATFLATVGGREPPLPRWLTNRRRAESLRREYMRYLMSMPPYDLLEGYQKRITLSQRAADINRGVFPDETSNN
jgi:hypothetical protein